MNQSSVHKNNSNSKDKDYPIVSIVVPAYNHENYIKDCIYSILEQDWPHIDLIVINDGSTDRTDYQINGILSESHGRFRYISKVNEGLIKTLNLGLKLAYGEYICEIASDDMLLPGSIRKRVTYLEENPDIDVVFADAYLINDNNKTDIRLSKDKKQYSSSKHTINDLIEGTTKIFFPSGMFRKLIIENLGGFDEDFRYYEDLAMKYQLAIHAKIGYLGEPVMYYRRHPSNISYTNRFQVRREKLLALKKIYPSNDKTVNMLLRKAIFKEYMKYAKTNIRKHLLRKNLW